MDNRGRGTLHGNSSRDRRRGGTTGKSGSGSRSGYRNAYGKRGGFARGSRRKRRPQFGITRILIGIIVVAVAVICIVAVFKLIGGKVTRAESAQMTNAEEPQLRKEVTVDGITITGMSKADAKKAILDKYQWGMKIALKDETLDVANLLEPRVDVLLKEIYEGQPKESYSLELGDMEAPVQAEVKRLASKWDVPPKNGSISSFDKDSGQFIYTGEENGFQIDETQLASDILSQLNAKNYSAVVKAGGHAVAPEITEAQAKKMYQVLGTYTTTTTANKDRNKNIELASDALNGMIIQPGAEFSFNNATGERSRDKGYRPAGAYVNGELVEEPGGGVCQVSSTLYNAVVFSGLTTTERHAHSYEPSYVIPGEDAMVSYGGPDMKFANNSTTAIAIRSSFSDRKLKISIVGIPILEKGVVLSMESKKTTELDAPAPIYEEDQTLQPGVEKVVKQETKGSRWVTNLVTKKDGVGVSDEFFHNSTYRGKPATLSRNTTGVVIPAATEAEKESEAPTQSQDSGISSTEETQATDPIVPNQTRPHTEESTQSQNQGPGGHPNSDTNQTLQHAAPGQNGPDGGGPGKGGELSNGEPGKVGSSQNPAGNGGYTTGGETVPITPTGP